MLNIIIIRPGATNFDEQGRIQGSLDIPLSDHGETQAAKAASELSKVELDAIYAGPCESCLQTASTIADTHKLKVKVLDDLINVDHGLWQGKLREEVKKTQPKVYRQWQEHAQSVCPPEGETWAEARSRLRSALTRIVKKHKSGVVGIVAAEPLASLVCSTWKGVDVDETNQVEGECGSWQLIETMPPQPAASTPN